MKRPKGSLSLLHREMTEKVENEMETTMEIKREVTVNR